MSKTRKTETKPKSWDEARRLARKNREEMTPEEDAAITAAAEADPDNPPLDDDMLARLRPARPRGRPRADAPKVAVKLRLDPDLLDTLRASGPGWQTRANTALRKAFGLK
tara:strand:+ start:16568 stop:16897 length:330 start_codon:yes stop_codon:yes gene_type:complete